MSYKEDEREEVKSWLSRTITFISMWLNKLVCVCVKLRLNNTDKGDWKLW